MEHPNSRITRGTRLVGWCGNRAETLGVRENIAGRYARPAQNATAHEVVVFADCAPVTLVPVRGMRGIEVRDCCQPVVRYDPNLYTADEAASWERDLRHHTFANG